MLVRAVLKDLGHTAAEGDGNQDGAPPVRPDRLDAPAPAPGHVAPHRRAAPVASRRAAPGARTPPDATDRDTLFEAIRAVLVRAASDAARHGVPGRPPMGGPRDAGAAPAAGPVPGRRAGGHRGGLPERRYPTGAPDPQDADRASPGRTLARDAWSSPSTPKRPRRCSRSRSAVQRPPSLSASVFDRTDGVPFFVEELGAALASGGRLAPGPFGLELLQGHDLPLPDSVRDAVLLQAADLSRDARTTALAAAVAGQEFSPNVVICGDRPPGMARRAARPRARSSESGPERMRFRHALIRDAFYGEIPWAQRATLHRLMAEQLAGSGAPAVVIAEHWVKAREPERARTCFVAAAEGFDRVHAYRDAAKAARRALDLWPDTPDGDGADRPARTPCGVGAAVRRSERSDRHVARGGRGMAGGRRPGRAG